MSVEKFLPFFERKKFRIYMSMQDNEYATNKIFYDNSIYVADIPIQIDQFVSDIN